MLNKILFLFTLCVYCYGNDPIFRNDYKYSSEANGWFKLHTVPMKWQDAWFMCYYEGAILASPLNDRLQAGIAKFLYDHRSSAEIVYSGVSTPFAQGIYQSIGGTDLKDMSIRWSENEPAQSYGCCLCLVFFSGNGTMASKYCNYASYPFLCYKENNERMDRNECGTVDYGYRRVRGSSKCYKYHTKPVNWNEAYKICYAEGAMLATDYNIQLSELGKKESDVVYVGYKYTDDVWYDIIGNRMEPYKTGDYGNGCGARTWDGNFTNKYCYDKNSFLCEKIADKIV